MKDSQILQAGPLDVAAASDGRLVLLTPIRFKRSSGRAQVTLPDGAKPRPWNATPTPLQLALARGHRWLAMLESGEVKSLRQIAEREQLDLRYIRRMVRLTSLSPHIVEAILDDALPSGSSLFDFSNEVPLLWAEQGGLSRQARSQAYRPAHRAIGRAPRREHRANAC